MQDNSAITRSNNILVLFYRNKKIIGGIRRKTKHTEPDFKKNVITWYSCEAIILILDESQLTSCQLIQ